MQAKPHNEPVPASNAMPARDAGKVKGPVFTYSLLKVKTHIKAGLYIKYVS
jgi:hypothetical protein